MTHRIVRVALDVPRAQLFDYVCTTASPELIGRRVLVPFGRRTMLGLVIGVEADSQVPAERLKRVSRVVDEAPQFTAEDLRLLKFAADYYQYPLGQVVTGALPVKL